MTLRFPFPALQHLSGVIASVFLLIGPAAALAQAPAAPGADYVILKAPAPNTQPRQLVGVLVVAVKNGKVTIRDASGQIDYDVSQLQEVRKAVPPEFVQAQRLIEAGDMEKALPLVRSVAERFRGLPIFWANDASAMLGNVHLSLGQLLEAETAFNDFQKAYSTSGSLAASVGKARLAAQRGKYQEARSIAEPLVADAMKKKTVSRAENQIFGQAYFALGRAAEGEGKFPEAMDHYCKTVAIFYQERSVVAEAQKRIDELRKKGITTP